MMAAGCILTDAGMGTQFIIFRECTRKKFLSISGLEYFTLRQLAPDFGGVGSVSQTSHNPR